ncbi:hypothetical protein SAMN05216390_13617 [Lachnospiraceae bacterium KH1T2]|nr:hypothetical protein SAMN05216390_13617 [Lachnospiraceae bacterium KH1T2]
MNLANLFYNALIKVDKRMAKIIFNTLLLIALISTFAIYKFLISLPASECVARTSEELLLKTNINARTKMYNWANSSRKYSFDEFAEEMDRMWAKSRKKN